MINLEGSFCLKNGDIAVGIDPKDHIKLQNIVFPDAYFSTSSLEHYIYSMIGQETPFEAIGKLTDYYRRIFIDSSVYKLSNSLVDKNGNLVFFPRFLGDQVLDKDRISFLNKVAECSVKNPELALKMIEDFTNPLRGKSNHELERLLPKIKFLPFKDEDIKKIVEALMILMPDGISFKSFTTQSLSNATCTSLTSGSKGVINFSFANDMTPSIVVVDDIRHEIKGVFSKYGVRNMFDVIENLFNSMDIDGIQGSDNAFYRLLKVKGLGVANAQGIINASGGYVAGIGIAELCKIKIAQHLSIMNGGQEKFKEIASCFEPLREFPKIAEYVDCKELMQNKISQQIAIEAVAIGVRALVDLMLKNSQMSQNKKESILSTLENSTRIAGNAIAFGPANAILTSIVPVVSWSAKAQQSFPALLENWSGNPYRASIGFTDRKETESSRREDLERRIWNTSVGLNSSKSETPISSSIRQAFFIFFTYALTDSLTSLFTKEEEGGVELFTKNDCWNSNRRSLVGDDSWL